VYKRPTNGASFLRLKLIYHGKLIEFSITLSLEAKDFILKLIPDVNIFLYS
jgi:hypothetical protein